MKSWFAIAVACLCVPVAAGAAGVDDFVESLRADLVEIGELYARQGYPSKRIPRPPGIVGTVDQLNLYVRSLLDAHAGDPLVARAVIEALAAEAARGPELLRVIAIDQWIYRLVPAIRRDIAWRGRMGIPFVANAYQRIFGRRAEGSAALSELRRVLGDLRTVERIQLANLRDLTARFMASPEFVRLGAWENPARFLVEELVRVRGAREIRELITLSPEVARAQPEAWARAIDELVIKGKVDAELRHLLSREASLAPSLTDAVRPRFGVWREALALKAGHRRGEHLLDRIHREPLLEAAPEPRIAFVRAPVVRPTDAMLESHFAGELGKMLGEARSVTEGAAGDSLRALIHRRIVAPRMGWMVLPEGLTAFQVRSLLTDYLLRAVRP
jgi:hypothetical protein